MASDRDLDYETFQRLNLNELLTKAKSLWLPAYFDLFHAEAKKAKEEGREEDLAVFRLLKDLVSFSYDFNGKTFCPASTLGSKRTALPEDFTEDQLHIFEKLLADVKCPSMRARLADVLWVRRRDHRMARQAIACYSESAFGKWNRNDNPLYAVAEIRRSVHIAAELGKKNKDYPQQLEKVVKMIIDKEEENGYSVAELMELLLHQKYQPHASDISDLAERISKKAQNNRDYSRARDYLKIAADFALLTADVDRSDRLRNEIPALHVAEAEMFRQAGSGAAFQVASCIEKAIVAYRQMGTSSNKIDELIKELKRQNVAAASQVGRVSTPIDVKPLEDAAEKCVGVSDPYEAIISLACACRPQVRTEVEAQVRKMAEESPLTMLGQSVHYTSEGNISAKAPSAIGGNEDEQEKAFQTQIVLYMNHVQCLLGGPFFGTALRILCERGELVVVAFKKLVEGNPFIPKGREEFFLRGLVAGLRGDTVEAAHILIPQIENALRHQWQANNRKITRMTQQGIMREIDLGDMLEGDDAQEILGEDLVWELRSILIEGCGPNLRHRVMHGLAEVTELRSPIVNYLWWLMVHVLVVARLNWEQGCNH